MQNLVDIKSLNKDEIIEIIKLAEDFKQDKALSACFGKHIALLFYENSTRTRVSFEMAANKLGIHIYNFDAGTSSFSKGESMKDTIENLYAIGINAVVIRHSEAGIIDKIVTEINCPMKFANAGDGNHSHPTQALLDFYTMQKHIGSVEGKKIAINAMEAPMLIIRKVDELSAHTILSFLNLILHATNSCATTRRPTAISVRVILLS